MIFKEYLKHSIADTNHFSGETKPLHPLLTSIQLVGFIRRR